MFRTTIRSWFRQSDRRRLPVRRLRLESLENRITPSHTIRVDDDGHQFHHPDFNTIQAAVNAAHPGDHILVATGTYREQVVIPAGKDHLDIDAVGNAVITAPATYGDATRALVHVNGAHDVEIEGFRIQGDGSAMGPNFGVLVDGGGSAEVSHDRFAGIRDNPLGGRQEGVAIQFGQLTSGGPGTGEASHNSIEGYQKGGVVVIGQGSSAEVKHNTIRGAGATAVIAQNGIQISDGATATVEHNTVSGNSFTGPTFEGVGILIFNTSNVRVNHNRTFNNDEGILLFGDTGSVVTHVTVAHNDSDNNTFNGIGLFNVTNSTVEHNDTDHNGSDGINLEMSSHNQVTHNHADRNGRDGIALESDATDNVVTHNEMFHNVMFDAFDGSTGSGTAGTANTWNHNHFRTSSPGGLM
jgi:parallel beta-helix repeat protein